MKYFITIIISLLFSVSTYSQFLTTIGGGGSEPSLLLDSLFAYYSLDDPSGDAIDEVGGRDLTLAGTVTQGVGGKVGDCYTFITDGQAKYTADDFDFASSFSVSLWAKTASTGAQKGIVTYIGAGLRGWTVRMNSGDPNALPLAERYWVGGSVWSTGTTITNDDGWHHIVYTFDDATNDQKIYVDGDLEDTDNNATATVYVTDCDLEIGSEDDSFFFDGEIDEVAIYRGMAISEGKVDSLWNSGNGIAYPLDF